MAKQRDPRPGRGGSDDEARRVPAHPLARTPKPSPGPQARPRRPLPAEEQFFTPGAIGLRAAAERRSAAPLVFLFQLPRWIVPVAMVAFLLAGLVLADWRGALAVLPVAGFVGWLAYLSWPSLGIKARLLRVALLTVLALLIANRLGVF